MWAIVFKWAAILWPVVWQFIEPLLAKSQLNADLKWILPFAERMVRAVENTWDGRNAKASSTGKQTTAQTLIINEMKVAEPARAAGVPLSTVNLAIELALKRLARDAKKGGQAASSNAIPMSIDVEQSGTKVSQP